MYVTNESKEFITSQPLTIAYIRDSLRRNEYVGDMFEGLQFMLDQYDEVYKRLRMVTKPDEWIVVNKPIDYERKRNGTGADVV